MAITAGRTVPLAATRIYDLSFFTGFGTSAIVYYLLNRFFPAAGVHWQSSFEEVDVSAKYTTGSVNGSDREAYIDEDDKGVRRDSDLKGSREDVTVHPAE